MYGTLTYNVDDGVVARYGCVKAKRTALLHSSESESSEAPKSYMVSKPKSTKRSLSGDQNKNNSAKLPKNRYAQ